MAADLSRRMSYLSQADVERITALMLRAGLPARGPNLGPRTYLDLMGMDKKVAGGKLRFILLRKIGLAEICPDVPEPLLLETLGACRT